MSKITISPNSPFSLFVRRLESDQLSIGQFLEAGIGIDFLTMVDSGQRIDPAVLEVNAQLRLESLKRAIKVKALKPLASRKDTPPNASIEAVVSLTAMRAFALRHGDDPDRRGWLCRWCDVWISLQRAKGANIDYLTGPAMPKRDQGRPPKWPALTKFWEERVARHEVLDTWKDELNYLEQIAATLEPSKQTPSRGQVRDKFRPKYQECMLARK